MKLLALMADTIREVYSKKVILGLIVVEALGLGVIALVLFLPGMQAEYDEARGLEAHVPATDATRNGTRPDEPNDSSWRADSLDLLADSMWAEASTAISGHSGVFTAAGSSGAGKRASQATTEVSRRLLEKVKGQLSTIPVLLSLGALFLGIFATAGIIPTMMRRGTIELLLSKPVSRPTLLFGRITGGMAVMALNHLCFVCAIWTLYGAASGVWLPEFLVWMSVLPFLAWATTYSAVVYLSIITESWVLPVSLAYIHVMILNNFIYNREESIYMWIHGSWVRWVGEALYWMLPQISDLSNITMEAVFASSLPTLSPVLHSIAFIAIMSILSVWRLIRRDF